MDARQARAALIVDGVDPLTADIVLRYNTLNPDVWFEFEKVALAQIAGGAERLCAKAITEEIRKHIRKDDGSEYALNNNFPAYYARIFTYKYPEHRKRFEFRSSKGLTTMNGFAPVAAPSKENINTPKAFSGQQQELFLRRAA